MEDGETEIRSPRDVFVIEDNYNKQNIKGLHELILDVTDQFTEDIQHKLLSNIIDNVSLFLNYSCVFSHCSSD